ncbi:MAG: stage II sporulation protein M [Treponema sp.]|nr:stage II sporulation protein M [Treponema sp.]MCL2237335.1 stage II sporulation protein M [Treponema sp.]
MTEQSFVQRRSGIWNDFSVLVRGNRRDLKKGAVSFIRLFRELTQDLNTAKSNNYDPAIIERLNALVNEGNQILYGQHSWPIKPFLNFIWRTFPQKIRLHWKGVLACMLLFYGISFFFGFLCVVFPDISKELMSPFQLRGMENMYDPDNSRYLKPRNAYEDADMFGYYIMNNITIAFRTFAGGIFAGVGSLFLLCFNAGVFGIVSGHLINAGFSKTFFPFVIAHGSFELTAIAFSAYAGLILGYSFFITKGLSRTASLKKAGQDAFPIIAGSALMLVIAAVIEAFWSSKHLFPIELRIGSGIGCWVLVLFYFLFAGRKRKKHEPSF